MRLARVLSRLLIVLIAIGCPLLAGPIDTIAGQISQSSYTSYLNDSLYTHAGDNRGFGAQHDLARGNIYDAFSGFGLTTTLDPFTYSGSTYYNVVGELRGTTRPGDYYIVGAHYDSVNNPGADDNASGVAAVLEAARVLSQYDFEATILFIAFDREEQGLYGSTAWASEAFGAGMNVLGMVSVDMIAYNAAGANANTASLLRAASGASATAQNALAAAYATYVPGIATTTGVMGSSDHVPFANQGWASVLLIERAMTLSPRQNTNYHQATDSVDTANYIDYAYATQMTRGVAAYLASEAELATPEPATLGVVLVGLAVVLVRLRRRAA